LKAIPILPAILLLTGCGGGGSSPPAQPPPPAPPFSLSISPFAPGWAVTHGKQINSWSNGGFDFPVCANPIDCGPGYVEYPMRANISSAAGISARFKISGDNPVFSFRTEEGNTCDGPPAGVRLFMSNGNLANRWFSNKIVTLALGEFEISETIHDMSLWQSVPPAVFWQVLAAIGSVGFGIGGGCFAAHNVAVTSGRARFDLTEYKIQ